MDRTKGIGGTDIGAIIGVNPWRGIMDVYLEKVGITEGQPDNEAMYWGREMEPVLQKRYEKETNQKVFNFPTESLPLFKRDIPWMVGSPDGIILPNMDLSKIPVGGVDYKTTGRRDGWGEPGTDQVPDWIHTQADWYMGLTGAEWWDIAVLFFSPRREFAIYRIPRNQELIDNLIEAGKDFWENHVVPQIPPPIDASEGSKKLLNYLYPRETEDLLEANTTIEMLVEQLKRSEKERDDIIEELTGYQNRMKDIIGTHVGVQTSLGKVTWKKSKDREQVDWKGVADYIATMTDYPLEKVAKKFTTFVPGSRVFRSWWKREDS